MVKPAEAMAAQARIAVERLKRILVVRKGSSKEVGKELMECG